MSVASRSHRWFGCMKCHTFFPTLERGIQHLIHSPLHTSETIDLIDKYSDAYRDAAARTLITFRIDTDSEREDAIAEAHLDALQQAAGRHNFQPEDAPKRLELAVDVSTPRCPLVRRS